MKTLIRHLLVIVTLALLPAHAAEEGIQFGIQTWTLRNLKFDQVVEFAVKHGVKNLELIPNHINAADPKEVAEKKAILEKNGLQAYTFGVAQMGLDKEKNRQLFEFAKKMGMKLIIIEPSDYKSFDNIEELVKEYDIKVAVHNHGIRSPYGNPAVLKNLLQHRDRRLGVCLDAGWITAAGFDAAKVFRDHDGRVYDIHLKDKKVEPALGDTASTDTQIGQGNANLKGLIAELKKSNWHGVMAAETDSPIFAQQPAEFVDTAKAFFEAQTK